MKLIVQEKSGYAEDANVAFYLKRDFVIEGKDEKKYRVERVLAEKLQVLKTAKLVSREEAEPGVVKRVWSLDPPTKPVAPFGWVVGEPSLDHYTEDGAPVWGFWIEHVVSAIELGSYFHLFEFVKDIGGAYVEISKFSYAETQFDGIIVLNV